MLALLAVWLCRPRRLAAIFSLLLVLAVTASAQTTIRVPQDELTIQAGIDATINGDTVLVSPGTYVENINFNGKAITVRSSDGPASTIIDGAGAPAPVVTMPPGLPAELSGFTVRNGGDSGIVVTSSSPTIRNNVIINNITSNPNSDCGGAGIRLISSSAVIENNTISNNSATCDLAAGGGIRIAGEGAPQIRANTIADNQAVASSEFIDTYGGGIAVASSSGNNTPVIANNTIQRNQAVYGAGVFVGFNFVSPVIVQNLIAENTGTFGAGLMVEYQLDSGSTTVTSNTIANNPGPAGAVYLRAIFDTQVSFFNNVMAVSGMQRALDCDSGVSMPTLENNLIFSAAFPGDWRNCPDQTGTNGNIGDNPSFANVSQSDYRLRLNSPAIDKGNNSAPNVQQSDLNGNPRIVDGDNNGVATIDIGAYEVAGSAGAPLATLSPGSLAFGNQPVGTTSASQVVILTNSGSAVLQLSGIFASGDFAQTNACTATLAPSASCAIQVTFTPTVPGPHSGSLSISSDTSGASPTVALSGTGTAPVASLAPSALSFGNQRVGTFSASQTVTLTNSGDGVLQLSGIFASGDFAQTNTCASTLAPSASCAIHVTFTPTARGARSGSLSISSDTFGPSPTVDLSGTGTAPVASLAPSALSFGNQLVGTSSASQTVTLTNSGDAALQLSGIFASGDFAQTNTCASTLAPSLSCAIHVTFAPTARGPRSGSLSISSDTFGASPTVALSGTGTVPVASLAPTALSFGNQRLGTSSASQAVMLRNTGTAPLHITGFPVNGDFAQTNNCPATLDPAAVCTVNVNFTPTASGLRTGTLTVSSDSADAAPVVSLSGTGGLPVANVAPTALVFSTQLVTTTSAAQAVILSNTGTGTLHISAITTTGDFAPGSSCGTQLAPSASCAVNVTFTPTATGLRVGTLSLASDGSASPLQVGLSGNGITGAPSLSPSSLAFGILSVGAQSAAQMVNVTANGPGPLRISAINVSAGFSQTNNCPVSLSQGSSCTISVVFKPVVAGPASGTLSIVDDGVGSPHSITLSGTAVDFRLAASPSSISIDAGKTARFTVVVSAIGGPFNSSVTLTSSSALPDDTRMSLSPLNVIPGSTSATAVLTIQTKKNGRLETPPGAYTITITGTSGAVQHSTQVTLIVNSHGGQANRGKKVGHQR